MYTIVERIAEMLRQEIERIENLSVRLYLRGERPRAEYRRQEANRLAEILEKVKEIS